METIGNVCGFAHAKYGVNPLLERMFYAQITFVKNANFIEIHWKYDSFSICRPSVVGVRRPSPVVGVVVLCPVLRPSVVRPVVVVLCPSVPSVRRRRPSSSVVQR